MNPWKQGKIEICRNAIRFAFWVALSVNGGMAAMFSIAFCWEFFRHAWTWCRRVLFSSDW